MVTSVPPSTPAQEAGLRSGDEIIAVNGIQAAGVTPGDRAIPGWLVRSIAYVGETTFRTLGLKSKPPLVRFTANIMSRDCTLTDAKARREMGYNPPTSIDDGLKALAASIG